MTFLTVRPNAAGIAQPNPARIAALRSEHLEIRMFYVGHGEANLIVFPDRRGLSGAGSRPSWCNMICGTVASRYGWTNYQR